MWDWNSQAASSFFVKTMAKVSNATLKIGKVLLTSLQVWSIWMRREFFDWEKSQWNCFMQCPDGVVVRKDIQDMIAWKFIPSGIFSVSSFRRRLEELDNGSPAGFTLLWNGTCPPKVELFLWQLVRGRVLVADVLHRFGVGVSLVCKLCNNENETLNHVFLHYAWSRKVWYHCLNRWEVSSCSNEDIKGWWENWNGLCLSPRKSRIWDLMFFATVWKIWEMRNATVFRDIKACVWQAIDKVKFRMAWWFKHHGLVQKKP
ncbi:hypothetical protein Dsin_016725 [Dipteronia sinensis]|uniref:Reverse transcriptase zinc-binding domain-containing protein n=1 Tax=Dipteronia sinensis TaxID=43782 RepID=A0AAE0ADQ7_9ROSI|nr:hypothetical protein Dsin_016725 [Dipteronia sinensis]